MASLSQVFTTLKIVSYISCSPSPMTSSVSPTWIYTYFVRTLPPPGCTLHLDTSFSRTFLGWNGILILPATDDILQVDWTPRGRGSRTEKRKVVPSLFDMCLDLLADNFDHVESLGSVLSSVLPLTCLYLFFEPLPVIAVILSEPLWSNSKSILHGVWLLRSKGGKNSMASVQRRTLPVRLYWI